MDTLLCLLSPDLRKEIEHLLHRHYFNVVSDELLVMTSKLRYSLSENYPIDYVKIYCGMTYAANLEEYYVLALPRWQIIVRTARPFITSMFSLKKELHGKQHSIMIDRYNRFYFELYGAYFFS